MGEIRGGGDWVFEEVHNDTVDPVQGQGHTQAKYAQPIEGSGNRSKVSFPTFMLQASKQGNPSLIPEKGFGPSRIVQPSN